MLKASREPHGRTPAEPNGKLPRRRRRRLVVGLPAHALAAEDNQQKEGDTGGNDEAQKHGVLHPFPNVSPPRRHLHLVLEHVLVGTLLETHQVHPGPDAVQVLVVFLHVHGGLVELRITADAGDAAEERQKGDEKVQHG